MLERVLRYVPGLLAAGAIAVLAWLLDRAGFGAALLYALLFGMLGNAVAGTGTLAPGVDFSAKHLLAVAVALLGARLTAADVAAIGVAPAIVVVVALAATLAFGLLVARALGLSPSLGVLAGGGTAFCGASAAVAIAAVLPPRPDLERDTALVIAGVIGLSAIAMLAYPVLAVLLGLDDVRAGIFLGGSIHNVPQAVAAGFTVSGPAGDTATLTKLFRVALIAPFVLAVALAFRRGPGTALSRIELPWFVVAFAALVVAGSFGWLPASLKAAFSAASGWLMLAAVAAIGMKTSLAAMREVGARVLVVLVLNSLVLAALVLAAALAGLV